LLPVLQNISMESGGKSPGDTTDDGTKIGESSLYHLILTYE